MIVASKTFIVWVKPLLDEIELFILLNHIKDDPGLGFVLCNRRVASKKTGLQRHKLRNIRDKLECLAYLYALETSAFPDMFEKLERHIR